MSPAFLYVAMGLNQRRTGAAPAPEPSGLTPALSVTTHQNNTRTVTEVVSGSTTITGPAPLFMHFDASGSRSESTGCDTVAGACFLMGYRLNYGEGLGGTWPYSGLTRDEDVGFPIFFRAFTEIGTHTVRLKVKDPDDRESTITFTVVVQDPQTVYDVVSISEGGAWPTMASGTCYTIAAGLNVTAKGTPNTDGLRDIVFMKTGSGADPLMAQFTPDSRRTPNGPVTRASNVRLWNIDTTALAIDTVGFDFCGVVGGRCRHVEAPIIDYVWDNDVNTEAKALSIRRVRGVILWDCGEVNITGDYVWIGDASTFVMQGLDLHKEGGASGGHVIRGGFHHSVWRHNKFRVTAASTTYMKFTAVPGPGVPSDWRSDDVYGTWSGGSKPRYHVATQLNAIQNNYYGDATDSSELGIGVTPENNDGGGAGPFDGLELTSVEDNYFHRASGGFGVSLGGRNLGSRNNRYSAGSGGYVAVGESHNPNRIPSGWDGPYVNETTNTRPVPSAF